MGYCEFRNINQIATNNRTILTISGVAFPTSDVNVKIDFLEDYAVFADIPCRIKLTTSGYIQTNISRPNTYDNDLQGNSH
jgi:hypothetical protein